MLLTHVRLVLIEYLRCTLSGWLSEKSLTWFTENCINICVNVSLIGHHGTTPIVPRWNWLGILSIESSLVVVIVETTLASLVLTVETSLILTVKTSLILPVETALILSVETSSSSSVVVSRIVVVIVVVVVVRLSVATTTVRWLSEVIVRVVGIVWQSTESSMEMIRVFIIIIIMGRKMPTRMIGIVLMVVVVIVVVRIVFVFMMMMIIVVVMMLAVVVMIMWRRTTWWTTMGVVRMFVLVVV